jgi:hypothetical protein
MSKTDTEFRIWELTNRTESQYVALTESSFIGQIQEIPIKDEGSD